MADLLWRSEAGRVPAYEHGACECVGSQSRSTRNASIATPDPPHGERNDMRTRRLERLGQEIGRDDPEHCARSEPEADRQEARERLHEEERRDGHQGLRQARDDAPGRGRAYSHAARDEHEADREPFRDVVHRDRDRDQDAERLLAAEGDADAYALRERVEGHHAHDEEGAERVRTRECAEVQLVPAPDDSAGDGDEQRPHERARRGARDAVPSALVAKAEARANHEAGGEPVRHAEPGAARVSSEDEGKRAEARRERCRERGGEAEQSVHGSRI
jgi:hypothetical protein